jgi:cytosine/adenosine deaminase-related metal-dependent hydrolase
MMTTLPAKLMKLPDYGIAIGNPADLVVLDCGDASSPLRCSASSAGVAALPARAPPLPADLT